MRDVEGDCGHSWDAFYERLNTVLNAEEFDQRIEAVCRKYYKSSSGRPSITPGTYFGMPLLGYLEGIDSERGITWREADSLSFRKFLGYDLSELTTNDHSTVSCTRRLYAVHIGRGARDDGAGGRLRRHDELRGNARRRAVRSPEGDPAGIEEVVMDKGYYSGAVSVGLAEREIRSYVPEPERGQRNWAGKAEEQRCVYANRRRVRAQRSKRLQNLRGELCERSFAHCCETGSMRRMYVRGTDNALKRVLVQAAAFNIGLFAPQVERLGQAAASTGAEKRLNCARIRRTGNPEHVPNGLELALELLLPIVSGDHAYAQLASRLPIAGDSATAC